MEISKQSLRRIVQKCTHKESIEDVTDIFEELQVDSVVFVEILAEVEELIGSELPAELFMENNWRTINIMYESLQKTQISRD